MFSEIFVEGVKGEESRASRAVMGGSAWKAGGREYLYRLLALVLGTVFIMEV